MGAFWGVDAAKLTIYYPSTWNDTKIQELKDAILASGMKGTPNYSAGSPPAALSLLDAARLFGL